MSGFLKQLVQRNLSMPMAMRPRPVSIFETERRSTAFEDVPADGLEAEPEATAADHRPTGSKLASQPDPVAETLTPVEVALSPKDEKERKATTSAFPHLDADEPPHDRPVALPTSPEITPRANKQPAAAHNVTSLHERSRQANEKATVSLVGEETSPSAYEPLQHRVPAENVPKSNAEFRSQKRHAGEAQPQSASTDLHDFFMQTRRLDRRLRPPAESDSSGSKPNSDAPSTTKERFGRSIEVVRIVERAPSESTAVVEPDIQTVVSLPDSLHGQLHDGQPTPPQAILVPRLQAEEAVAQPAQSLPSKAAEKTVHVTIGRVEVRAIAVPATRERPKPMKPVLGLSDYLHRRSRGQA